MSKYNETMEHLELRPEMEEKILARLREEQESIKAAAETPQDHGSGEAGAAGIAAAAGGIVMPERREAEVSHAARPQGSRHGAAPRGRWQRFALGAAAAAMVCVMAGQGFYDQYIKDNADPGSGTTDHQTAVEEKERGGSDPVDISVPSSGTKSGSSSSGDGQASGTSGQGAVSASGKNGGSSQSGSSKSGSSGSTGGSSHGRDSSGDQNNSNNNNNNNTDNSGGTDQDDEPSRRTAVTIRSIADASDALAKVRIISEEGPDSDGFYTYTAEVTDIVYGKLDSKVMTVCLFDSQGKPQLSPGDSAYFFLKQVGSDEFYITKEDAGVVRISGGEVVFADGVTFTGYRQDSNYRMQERDFVRYLN